MINKEGHVVQTSESIPSLLGYSAEELHQMSILDFAPTFDFKSLFVSLNNDESSYHVMELLLLSRSSENVPVHLFVTLEALLEQEFLVIHVNDVCSTTAHIENEADLTKQIELLRFLIDEVPSPLVVKNYEGKFVLTNKAVAELYGASSPELMIGKDDGDYIPDKELADFFTNNVRQIMDQGKTQTVFEDSIDVNTGEVRNFQSIKRPFINELGEKHILLIATDITELRNIQSDLEEQKDIFRQVIDEFPSPFLVKDYNGKFVLTNKTLAKLYNVDDPDSMIGKDDGDYIPHLKHAENFKHNVRSIMDKGETQVVYEDSFDVKSGQRRHYMSITKPFVNHKGEQQILVIANDITDMRKAEKTLMQYEKIMSISHDFLAYVDKDYTYQAVNDTYLNAFQLSREEIVGKTSQRLFGDDFFYKVIKPKFNIVLQGKEVNYETWVSFPALGERFVDVSYHPYFAKDSTEVEGLS